MQLWCLLFLWGGPFAKKYRQRSRVSQYTVLAAPVAAAKF
jgi:hypothetical protein